MSYTVVFEYTEQMGGMYGVRTITTYESPQEFRSLFLNHDNQIVVAEGVASDAAQNLASLTPDICRLACAVEQAYRDCGGNIDPDILHHEWVGAIAAIEYSQFLWVANGSKELPEATKYVLALRKNATSNSKKDQIIRLILGSLAWEKTGLMYLGQYPTLLDRAKAILKSK